VKLTDGRTIVEVPDHKAQKFINAMGLRPVDATPEAEEVETPKPKRGRPPKKAS
jgi:hypothetical protein